MLIFILDILPQAQKQTRFSFRGGKPRCYDPSLTYKTHLQWQMKAYAPPKLFEGPVKAHYTFYLPVPKSTPARKRQEMLDGKIFHIKKPDVDNLAYVVTNALKGIIIKDDSQIVEKTEYKTYGSKPKIVVKLDSLDEMFPLKDSFDEELEA